MRYITFFCLIILALGCDKDPDINDVIKTIEFSQKEIFADGQSTVTVRIELSEKSSSDRRNIVFSTSSGVFTASGNDKYIAKAEFENGSLIAKAVLRSSTQPGMIKVFAQPEFDSPIGEFVKVDSIPALISVPASIKLEPSSFGIASNFINEVLITGNLRNSSGKFVSEGYKILFEDSILLGPANGQFRSLQNITTDSSFARGYYSASANSLGTQIKIRGTLLDINGQKTTLTDSILLTINQ